MSPFTRKEKCPILRTKELPPIQVYARPVGYLQWICPHCHEIFGARQIPWRQARITCTGCNRSYRLGIGFLHDITTTLSPFNARIADWCGPAVNTYQTLRGTSAIARMRGRLDWVCPQCHMGQSGQIGRELMDIGCQACGAFYFLHVILYRASPGITITTPIDWAIPSYESTKVPYLSLSSPSIGQI